LFAYGVLDTNYRWDMTVDEAVKLGMRAISSATFRDSASGGIVRVYHVTQKGYWEVIHEGVDVSILHEEFEQSKGHVGDGRENQPQKLL